MQNDDRQEELERKGAHRGGDTQGIEERGSDDRTGRRA